MLDRRRSMHSGRFSLHEDSTPWGEQRTLHGTAGKQNHHKEERRPHRTRVSSSLMTEDGTREHRSRSKPRVSFMFVVFCFSSPLSSVQAQSTNWTVRPEWIRAHEEFLASDVMAGRGSATRDEQIAATYVASEFMSYGLKPPPGMTSYLQAAEIDRPQLDGSATLTVGGDTLKEGTDFKLLTSSGKSVQATLLRSSGKGSVPKRSTVLIPPGGTSSMQAINEPRRSGASLLVATEDPSTQQMSAMLGGKTRMPIGLRGSPAPDRAPSRSSAAPRWMVSLLNRTEPR